MEPGLRGFRASALFEGLFALRERFFLVWYNVFAIVCSRGLFGIV